jgi:hypothetical protein
MKGNEGRRKEGRKFWLIFHTIYKTLLKVDHRLKHKTTKLFEETVSKTLYVPGLA